MSRWKYFCFAASMIASSVLADCALARTCEVGAQRDLKRPSDAAALVRDGDIVRIDPGEYADCAVWRADNLTIEGEGDVIVQGPVCGDKALFVVTGAHTTIRAIAFAHARSSDRNGAGIRGEGIDLTVENSRFADNENGILAGDNPQSHIVIRDSVFTGNGTCDPLCAHGIYVNRVASLQVSNSTFFQQKAGHHIKSRALRSEIVGNVIEDGPAGTASYAVDIPDGGALVLRDNIIEKGPRTANPVAAVSIGEESRRNPAGELTVADNMFFNDNAASAFFVRNLTATVAALAGNAVQGDVVVLAGPGRVSP